MEQKYEDNLNIFKKYILSKYKYLEKDELEQNFYLYMYEFINKKNIDLKKINQKDFNTMKNHIKYEFIKNNSNINSYNVNFNGKTKTIYLKQIENLEIDFNLIKDEKENYYSYDYSNIVSEFNKDEESLRKRLKKNNNSLFYKIKKKDIVYSLRYSKLLELKKEVSLFLLKRDIDLETFMEEVDETLYSYIDVSNKDLIKELEKFIKYVNSYPKELKFVKINKKTYNLTNEIKKLLEVNNNLKVFTINSYGVIVEYC